MSHGLLRCRPSFLNGLAVSVLALFLWPIVYATWVSFTPGELLEPPSNDWSLRWYREFFTRPDWTSSLMNSLLVAVMASGLSVLAGGGLAVAVTRSHFRGHRALGTAALLPLFVPGVVLGMALLPLVRELGLWGTLPSVAAAHSLWGLPLVFLVVRAALEGTDPELESAARGLGANTWQTFVLVTLPLMAPSLMAGALMAFIVSLNELVMALFLCTPAIDTLPKVMWPNLRYTLTPLVAAASGVSVLLTLLLLFGVWGLLGLERTLRRLVR